MVRIQRQRSLQQVKLPGPPGRASCARAASRAGRRSGWKEKKINKNKNRKEVFSAQISLQGAAAHRAGPGHGLAQRGGRGSPPARAATRPQLISASAQADLGHWEWHLLGLADLSVSTSTAPASEPLEHFQVSGSRWSEWRVLPPPDHGQPTPDTADTLSRCCVFPPPHLPCFFTGGLGWLQDGLFLAEKVRFSASTVSEWRLCDALPYLEFHRWFGWR